VDKYAENRKKHYKIKIFVCKHCNFLIKSSAKTGRKIKCPYCKTEDDACNLYSKSMKRADIEESNSLLRDENVKLVKKKQ